MTYKILVIPGARDGVGGALDLDSEIMLLSTIAAQFETIEVDVVPIAESTEVGLATKLALSDTVYDAAHWLGHADDNGFYLDNGEQLSQERIQRLCVDSGARTVFLNSCESGRIAQYLVNNKIAVALSYAVPVLDRDGILNALRFYSALARSSDPFQDGLREAYIAADPGDGTLLWLTNGQYVQEIIKPILTRLDEMSGHHDTSLSSFSNALTVTRGAFKALDGKVSAQLTRLSRSSRHTRMALLATMLIILICTAGLVWAASSFSTSLAALRAATATAMEPGGLTATWTPRVPPKNTHGATPQKPTRKPSSTSEHGDTIPPRPTATPTGTPTATLTPITTPMPTMTRPTPPTPTRAATSTRRPMQPTVPASTATPTERSEPPTAALTPFPTQMYTLTPTDRPAPTSTPTLTSFAQAVQDAVAATVAALPVCECGR